MNLHFDNLWVLYLLWIIPATAVWWHFAGLRKKRKIDSFISPEMQKKLSPSVSTNRHLWQNVLVSLAIMLALIAIARPQWGTKDVSVYQKGRDVVIALDVSRSMLAEDVHPNRLQRAKIDIIDLIKDLKGDRAALIAFRQNATMLCPLTTDYAYLLQSLNAVDIDSAPRGQTDIGSAIGLALKSFDNKDGSHKAIVLISDGEDISGRALDAAKEAGARNIPIFTVGIGSRNGAKIPKGNGQDGFMQYQGKDVITKIDNDALFAIAEASKGVYVPIGQASTVATTLGTLYTEHLKKISAQDLEETLQRRRVERYEIFLVPAIILLFVVAFLSRGRLAVSKLATVVIAIIMGTGVMDAATPTAVPQTNSSPIVSSAVQASTNAPAVWQPESVAVKKPQKPIPPGRAGARIAQKLYAEGKYEDAARTYLDAAESSTKKSQTDFKFNAAASLFHAGKYKDASDILRELNRNDKESDNKLSMGLGTALYHASAGESTNLSERVTLLHESAEAFKDAARAGVENARDNLAVAVKDLPQLEDEAHMKELMSKYKTVPASQIVGEMLSNQRDITKNMPVAFANDSPDKIKELEALAEKQDENAELLTPLKAKLLAGISKSAASSTNAQQQITALNNLVEASRNNMTNSADCLRELDQRAFGSAVNSEAMAYQVWKALAPYDMVLNEDIRLQTNAIKESASDLINTNKLAGEQKETLMLTPMFKERFQKAFPEKPAGSGATPAPMAGQAQQGSSTNNAGLSPEDRAKILELSDQVLESQKSALSLISDNNIANAIPLQKQSLDYLKKIKDLLPKKNNSQKNQQQKNKQDQKQQNKQQNKNQKPKEDKKKKEPKKQPPKSEKKQDKTPKDIKMLLEKAKEREKAHEAEKKERNRNIPMLPMSKDW